MHYVYVFFLITALCSLAFAEESFFPVSKSSATMGTSGMTMREATKKKIKLCPRFSLTYAKVQKATYFLINHIKPAEARYKRCKDKCYFCKNCDKVRDESFVKSAQACIKRHSFSACVLSIAILDRLDKVSSSCYLFFKNSRVGNCYVEEYLTLNGYRGKNNALVFYRESGLFNKKLFKCRAGKRAALPTPKNTHACRSKFRVSPRQLEAVSRCAFPAFTRASVAHSSCLARSNNIFHTNQCYISWRYNSALAYINCIVPHGVPAVAVASLYIGQNALNCPVLRRDSYVGRCKAADFVQLKRLKLLEIKGNYIKTLVPGVCKY